MRTLTCIATVALVASAQARSSGSSCYKEELTSFAPSCPGLLLEYGFCANSEDESQLLLNDAKASEGVQRISVNLGDCFEEYKAICGAGKVKATNCDAYCGFLDARLSAQLNATNCRVDDDCPPPEERHFELNMCCDDLESVYKAACEYTDKELADKMVESKEYFLCADEEGVFCVRPFHGVEDGVATNREL